MRLFLSKLANYSPKIFSIGEIFLSLSHDFLMIFVSEGTVHKPADTFFGHF